MINESESVLVFELKERFYYLKLMNEADFYCWKDQNGNFHLMDNMSIEYLLACIKKVENDLKAFIKTRGETDVVKILKPIAIEKLKELKNTLQKKSKC